MQLSLAWFKVWLSCYWSACRSVQGPLIHFVMFDLKIRKSPSRGFKMGVQIGAHGYSQQFMDSVFLPEPRGVVEVVCLRVLETNFLYFTYTVHTVTLQRLRWNITLLLKAFNWLHYISMTTRCLFCTVSGTVGGKNRFSCTHTTPISSHQKLVWGMSLGLHACPNCTQRRSRIDIFWSNLNTPLCHVFSHLQLITLVFWYMYTWVLMALTNPTYYDR